MRRMGRSAAHALATRLQRLFVGAPTRQIRPNALRNQALALCGTVPAKNDLRVHRILRHLGAPRRCPTRRGAPVWPPGTPTWLRRERDSLQQCRRGALLSQTTAVAKAWLSRQRSWRKWSACCNASTHRMSKVQGGCHRTKLEHESVPFMVNRGGGSAPEWPQPCAKS